MKVRFEAHDIEEAKKAIGHFHKFHDDYVAGIEIKFDNYKGMNDEGESKGIGDAKKTVILTINTSPYGKEHDQLVKVEFIDVKSFEITSPPLSSEPGGPMWGIFTTDIYFTGDDMKWEFDFICGDAKFGSAFFSVVCHKIILTSIISAT